MSETALVFALRKGLGSASRLSAYYDFDYSSSEAVVVGAGSNLTGALKNSIYAYDSGLHTGFVLNSASSDEEYTTGYLNTNLSGSKLNLSETNLLVPLDGLNANNISVIIDFEFAGEIDDGVIMGCLDKDSETINLEDLDALTIDNSQGFNIGVTDRGHLFCHTFGDQEDSISVLTSIELSKRNVIGISIADSILSLSRFDYLNNIVSSVDLKVDKNYTYNKGNLIFGGSPTYWRTSSESELTFDGSLHNLVLLSGYMDPEFLKSVGEGMLGEYYYNAPSEISATRVTGYSETIVYRTGITGYDYEVTGTLSISTGREYMTGRAFSDSSESKVEGERYYKYYTLNNGSVKTYYKEELGMLHPDSGYVYYPTGEEAYDTLGLNDISDSISTYTITSGIEKDGTSIDLYGKTPLTGTISEISGVTRTELSETFTTPIAGSSGVNLDVESEGFKKNFIYYMGDRS